MSGTMLELTGANYGKLLENPVQEDGSVRFNIEDSEVKQKLAFARITTSIS